MPEAVLELIPYALLFLALAFVIVGKQLTKALLGPIISLANFVPLVGPAVAALLDTIYQAVMNALGTVEGKLDHLIGAANHLLARQLDWLWRELRSHAGLIAMVSPLVAAIVYAVAHLRSLVNHLEHAGHAVTAGVKTLEREYHGIEHRVKVLEKDVAKGIGHDLRIQVKALDKELAHVEHKVIPAIRGEVTAAEGEITNLYEWAKGKASLIGVGTFAFAVAAVIGSDVFKLLRCNELGNLARKYRCGLWNLLGNLLGLAAFLTVAFDFQEFVDASEQVATFIGGAISEFEGQFPLTLPPLPPPN